MFADPFEEGLPVARPSLLVLDDGADSPSIRLERDRVVGAAERSAVRVHEVRAAEASTSAASRPCCPLVGSPRPTWRWASAVRPPERRRPPAEPATLGFEREPMDG